jgi:hypothetical protein
VHLAALLGVDCVTVLDELREHREVGGHVHQLTIELDLLEPLSVVLVVPLDLALECSLVPKVAFEDVLRQLQLLLIL